jgi:hypothetical protein
MDDKKEEGWKFGWEGKGDDGSWKGGEWVGGGCVVAGNGGRRTYIVVVFNVCGFIVCVTIPFNSYALQYAFSHKHMLIGQTLIHLTNLIPVNLHSIPAQKETASHHIKTLK